MNFYTNYLEIYSAQHISKSINFYSFTGQESSKSLQRLA